MTRRVCVMAVGLFTALVAPRLLAAPAIGDCRALADPAARLACYDTLAGQAPAIAPATAPSAAPLPSPVSQSPGTPPRNDYVRTAPTPASAPDLKHRPDFDSRLTAVIPQRHGYYRLVLDDGSAYLTTAVAPPLPVGADVHIRRTFVGTTYLDTKDRDPIAIRLARQQ